MIVAGSAVEMPNECSGPEHPKGVNRKRNHIYRIHPIPAGGIAREPEFVLQETLGDLLSGPPKMQEAIPRICILLSFRAPKNFYGFKLADLS
jgi:hypothetical protein